MLIKSRLDNQRRPLHRNPAPPFPGRCEVTHFQARFVVEYEADGEDTMVERRFAKLRTAQAFARRVTGDGTAWPAEARLYREISVNGEFSTFNDPERMLETYIDGSKDT